MNKINKRVYKPCSTLNVLPPVCTEEEEECSLGMSVCTPWVYNVGHLQHPGLIPPVKPTQL